MSNSPAFYFLGFLSYIVLPIVPKGLNGGKPGARGSNYLVTKDNRVVYLGGKNTVKVRVGEILRILAPGGGGWGSS
ncbi:hypothetical protein DM860_003732 [Cuscuta australis]|uniref:Hydantoinase B/oxoprolinase domain-containing protein n=1 Tax=Cuscuta australis TaxID=267555 RepID=A0A328DLR7_9ASTE|nr:hypothetical protein DM860_003732 [Cuscuta australis]